MRHPDAALAGTGPAKLPELRAYPLNREAAFCAVAVTGSSKQNISTPAPR
jgi:hypothetical protein